MYQGEEMYMYRKLNRVFRWLIWITSGALVFQTTGCDFWQVAQTGLLAGLTGMTYYLTRNISNQTRNGTYHDDRDGEAVQAVRPRAPACWFLT